MPYRRRGSSRKLRLVTINSNKNITDVVGVTGTTIQSKIIANTVDSATLAVENDVTRGCSIKAIWLSLDFCGLAATGVEQSTKCYIMKNPGSNLTPPTPFTEGTSNEKKFIFKVWMAMTMRNQDGNPPYHWEGWIKIPKVYQRMGANDQFSFHIATDAAAGHFSLSTVYKWYY